MKVHGPESCCREFQRDYPRIRKRRGHRGHRFVPRIYSGFIFIGEINLVVGVAAIMTHLDIFIVITGSRSVHRVIEVVTTVYGPARLFCSAMRWHCSIFRVLVYFANDFEGIPFFLNHFSL